MNKSILILDNDQKNLELMEFHFSKEGFNPIVFTDSQKAIKTIKNVPIDLIILRHDLNEENGLTLLETIRSEGIETPVIFINHHHNNEELFDAYEKGCDDYLSQPFTIKELIYRAKAVLRRNNRRSLDSVLIFKDIVLDVKAYNVSINQKPIDLTKLEFELLKTLMLHQTQVISREELLHKVWGDKSLYDLKTVNVAVTRLKEKIDPFKEKDYIKTLRGIGYTLR